MATVPADKLSETIAAELKNYADGVTQSLVEATKNVTKAGVAALRSTSRKEFGGTGKYARGWTSSIETGKRSAQGVIYNKAPGLPHLLEHGHAKRGGGRVSGRPHIAPVEETIAQEFTSEVEKNL